MGNDISAPRFEIWEPLRKIPVLLDLNVKYHEKAPIHCKSRISEIFLFACLLLTSRARFAVQR